MSEQVNQVSREGGKTDWSRVVARWWPCVVLVLLGLLARAPLWDLEFGRNGDGTGSMYGIAARNYLIRDNWATWWMPVVSVGDADSEPRVYAHHSPAVPLLMAAAVGMFGDHDWSMRLVPMLFTLGCGAMAYGLMLGIGGGRVGAVAAGGTMLFVPMSLRYGQMPDVVNSQVVFFSGLSVWMYVRMLERYWKSPAAGVGGWMRSGGLAWAAAMSAAMLTDWPAFFLVPVMGAHLALARPEGWRVSLGVLVGLSVGLFGLMFVWVSLATGNWGLILNHFLHRSTSMETDWAKPFTTWGWVVGMWETNRELHTLPLMALGGAGLLWGIGRGVSRMTVRDETGTDRDAAKVGHGWGLAARVAGLSGAWSAIHMLVGRQAAYNHQWWLWPVTFGLVIGVGVLARLLVRERVEMTVSKGVALVALLSLWGWWTVTEVRQSTSPLWLDSGVSIYRPRELGEFVRAHVPRGEAVVLYEDELQPYVVYNLDRAVIQRVYTPEDLERRIGEGRGDLFYGFDQKLERRPVAYVIPRAYLEKGVGMVEWLSGRYERVEGEKFVLFRM